MSTVCATTSNHEEVHESCLAPVAVGKGASSATLSVIADSQLKMRDTEGFGNNSSPSPEETVQTGNCCRESFKTVIKLWKCSSSRLMASVGHGEGLSYL